MKTQNIIIALSIAVISIFYVSSFTACKPSEEITSKTGAQIWGENCIRCHNAADPATFSDVEWEVAAMHMQIRANLTQDEIKKVIKFLKSSNNN